MAMGQIQSFPPVRIFQNKSGIKSYVRKERQGALTGRTVKRGAFFFFLVGALFYNIMVSIYHIKPLFPIELRQHLKAVFMHLLDFFHGTVFPQFISIAKLKLRKPVLVIISQRSEIQKLVFQKIIICPSGSAVAVTKKNIL